MSTVGLRARAYAIGFTDRPHVPELTDRPIQGLVYLHRVHEGQHCYLSLCHAHWDHTLFLEAVIEVFHCPRNPKARRAGSLRESQLKGATALYTNLARDWETIEGMVGKVYPLHVEPKRA